MNDATKHAIERTIRFIQDYGVEAATGYGEWQFWVSVPNAHEETEAEALGGAWAPGCQHALTLRMGDQTGTHCAQLWVTESIYQQACDLIGWMVPDGTVMGSRSSDDGYRLAIHGPIRSLEEAEDLMETAAELIAARDAQAEAALDADTDDDTYIGIPAASGDPLDTVIRPIAADYLDMPADADTVAACRRNLPAEHRDVIPESAVTWRRLGAALDTIADRMRPGI